MVTVLWSIAGFLVAIGVLVTFHEFGHYWVARRCGVKVLRFSVGFGRPIWRRTSADGVEFVVSAIPLGGYVKMLDERESESALPEALAAQAFNRQALWKRTAIVAAGPVFNFILAAAFYWMIHLVGVPDVKPVVDTPAADSVLAEAGIARGDRIAAINGREVPTWTRGRIMLLDHALAGRTLQLDIVAADGAQRQVSVPGNALPADPEALFAALGLRLFQPELTPRLAEVVAGEPAAQAGLQAGDVITAIDGQPVSDWSEVVVWIQEHPGRTADVQVERDGSTVRSEWTPAAVPGADGQMTGRIGARVDVPEDAWAPLRTVYREGPLQAAGTGIAQTGSMAWLTLRMLGRMIIGDVSVRNISGPLQIAEYAGYTAAAGLVTYLGFLALISVSLGVLNLLPIPMLDGGHLMYYLAEAIKGSPVSERTQIIGQQLGLLALAGLMGLAFYNDITRLLS